MSAAGSGLARTKGGFRVDCRHPEVPARAGLLELLLHSRDPDTIAKGPISSPATPCYGGSGFVYVEFREMRPRGASQP